MSAQVEEPQDMERITDSDSEDDVSECLAHLEVHYLNDVPRQADVPLFQGEELVVGREPSKSHFTLRENHRSFVIPDEMVSKCHFRIYSIIYENEKDPTFPPLIYCQDLESTNGTYVNGELIGKITQERVGHLLSDGDVIEIQPLWRFRFHQTTQQSILVQDRNIRDDMKIFQDRFEVSNRLLGQGRYGNVYLANETVSTKQVACKVIDINLAMRHIQESETPLTRSESSERMAQESKRKMLREIKILASLTHPNIIDLKKAFCSPTAMYLFTELSAGGDLYSYLNEHGGYLNDYNSRFIARQIALALQYLHCHDIAHRDVKPENVLVSRTFFGGRVVLTDFGFATHVSTTNIAIGGGKRSGRMFSRIGTDGYVAPEIMVDAEQGYTQAADLWSLGVLTVRLLIGNDDIPGKNMDQITPGDTTSSDGSQTNIHLHAQWEGISAKAQNFIRELLVKDPNTRMTADGALRHSWFTKPLGEAAALNDGINKINKFWMQRENAEEVIECIRGELSHSVTSSNITTSKFRKKVPDVTNSPYFSLDRHLTPRLPSTRKRVLDDLSLTGANFLTPSNNSDTLRTVPHAKAIGRRIPIESVCGSDIFGKSLSYSSDGEITKDSCLPEQEYGISFSDPAEHPSQDPDNNLKLKGSKKRKILDSNAKER